MPKWLKMLVAIPLIAPCIGVVTALGWVISRGGGADVVWVPMLAGGLCWLAVYLFLPKPIWIYVVGHELTHAVWVWAFGGRVKGFRATADGGHVVVTKTNFLIALAPYFFPFYAVLVVLVFAAGHLVWGWRAYVAWFHLLLGAAYAFHVTLTGHVLKTQQTDITQHGYLFSAVIIFLGNAGVLLVGIPLLTGKVGIVTALHWWLECTGGVFQWLSRWWS